MKKYNLLSGVLMSALVFAATGCSNDASEDSENVKVRITATSTIGCGATSRVALGADNDINTSVALNWQSGDKIDIYDSGTKVGTLTLQTGAGTNSATFTGEITEFNTNHMIAFYPTGAATTTDLTAQTGTKDYAGKHNVMYAHTLRSITPTPTPNFTFYSKTSILKFALPYPNGVTQGKVGSISATIKGVNSKGTLGTDDEWSSTSAEKITISALTAGADAITGYAVVIPGSNVNAMKVKVAITDKDNKVTNYMMAPYTGSATIAMGKIYNINKALTVPTNFKSTYTINDFYQWDAYSHY